MDAFISFVLEPCAKLTRQLNGHRYILLLIVNVMFNIDQESKKNRTAIFWNVWILLAMPATWLAWSLISFIVCIISLVWRVGTREDGLKYISRDQALIPRIIASSIFALGFIYFILIISTL